MGDYPQVLVDIDDVLATPEKPVDEVQQVLIDARKYITDQSRWIQGAFRQEEYIEGDSIVRVCAVGAVYEAAGHPFGVHETFPPKKRCLITDALRLLNKALPKWHRSRDYGVPGFNDAVGRQHDDVVQLFDRAIDLAEQEER